VIVLQIAVAVNSQEQLNRTARQFGGFNFGALGGIINQAVKQAQPQQTQTRNNQQQNNQQPRINLGNLGNLGTL